MLPDAPATAAALTVAADEPRWVEARGLLLSGRGRVVAGDQLASGWVVQSDDDRLSVVVAHPDAGELRRIVGSLHGPWTVMAHADAAEMLLGALADWQMTPATVHAHPHGMLALPEAHAPVPETAHLDPHDTDLTAHVPAMMRAQIVHASAHSPVVAAFAGGRPVAFAYAAFETESLWDVSVDTLEPFRRKGYATAAVRAMAAVMRRRFKRPVWGAFDSNEASIAMARRLGFEPVDRLLVFSRRETPPAL